MLGYRGTDELVDGALLFVAVLAETTIELADGASISLVVTDRLATVGASSDLVRAMDADQYRLGEGPCVSAHGISSVISTPIARDEHGTHPHRRGDRAHGRARTARRAGCASIANVSRTPESTLERALIGVSLSQNELWARCFGLGGMAMPIEIEAFLLGLLAPSAHDHEVLLHALNERYSDLGPNHPVPHGDGRGAPALRLLGAPGAADGTWRDRGGETVGAAFPFKTGFADWTALAGCREMDVTRFFSTDPESLADANLAGRGCEVRLSCLDEALRDAGIRAVWGGTSRTTAAPHGGGVRSRDEEDQRPPRR